MQYEVVNVMLTVTTYATVSTDSVRQMQKTSSCVWCIGVVCLYM